MSNDPDTAQALELLLALEQHVDRITQRIENAEAQRRPGLPAGSQERALRAELSEVHAHITRLHVRFPETRDVQSLP